MKENTMNVAVAQFASVFFDKMACFEKLRSIAKKSAESDVNFLLLPESFIPGYPRGFTFEATIGKRTAASRQLYLEYWQNSICEDDEKSGMIAEIAREYNLFLGVGVTERDRVNNSLYCSIFYYSPEDGFLGKHRKIKPTGLERVVWAEGDGSDIDVFQMGKATVGGLVCWENYMPLARMALYSQGVNIYLAPTADARETWISSMQHIALEGRCYVLACNQYFRKSDYPEYLHDFVKEEHENLCLGGSVIISPMGKILQGPLWGSEGLLIQPLDLDDIVRSKMDFDVIGHYARPDVFSFSYKKVD